MKRAIKIILILLAIFLLVLGVIWLIGRHTAKENGTAPLSFRQFIGLGGKEIPATGAGVGTGGANSSGFNNSGTAGTNGSGSGQNGNTNGNNPANASGIGSPNISQFTNGGITPSNSGFGNGNGNGIPPNGGNINNSSGNGTNGGINGGTGNNSGLNSGTNGSQGGVGSNTAGSSTALVCGDADTNITFTPQQLAQLDALQNRFYALAQTLHTDEDVATELANHDAFALKAAQVTELYNYCENKLPLVATAGAQLQKHVPTPFWNQWLASDTPANMWNTSGVADQDSDSFLDFSGLGAATQQHIAQNNLYNPTAPSSVMIDGSILGADNILLTPVVERILHVNLW
jgi:hypothetical protein